MEKEFNINNTTVSVNVFGDDAGDWEGKFGSIIDDLSLSLTLSDVVIAQEPEIIEISPVVAPEAIINPVVDDIEVNPVIIEPVPVEPVIAEPIIVETVQIGSLDATSIVNTISSGVIDINPAQDTQIENLSSQISVISDIRAEQMNMEIADVGINNEIPTNVDTGTEIISDNNIQEINNIDIESVNEPEPETLQEIREELPTELEEINMEEDLKENNTDEQQEKTPTENDENVGENEESDLSGDSPSEEKEESSEKEIKSEPTKNEDKVVNTTKTVKVEKNQGSDSSKSENKKVSKVVATPKIKSDIVVQELDLPTIISFHKEYFANTYKDTIDLTQTEMEFYNGQGFNSDYTQANIKWNSNICKSDCWGDMVLSRPVVKIEQFRR